MTLQTIDPNAVHYADLVRDIVAWFDVMHSKYVIDGTPVELSEEWPSYWLRQARKAARVFGGFLMSEQTQQPAESELAQTTIDAGCLIHIRGIPFRLVTPATVEGHRNNFKLAEVPAPSEGEG